MLQIDNSDKHSCSTLFLYMANYNIVTEGKFCRFSLIFLLEEGDGGGGVTYFPQSVLPLAKFPLAIKYKPQLFFPCCGAKRVGMETNS